VNETQTPRTDAAESNWWSEDGLRSAFIVRADFARELERENAILTAERDEARREVCAARRELCRNEAIIRLQRHRVHRDSEDVVGLAKEIAVERGWDCFKENTDGRNS